MPFGKSRSGLIFHQFAMKERRSLQPERAMEQHLSCGAQEQVCSAHDFSDLHGSVIHRTGQLIGGSVVLSPHDEVAKMFSCYELLWTETAVDE